MENFQRKKKKKGTKECFISLTKGKTSDKETEIHSI